MNENKVIEEYRNGDSEERLCLYLYFRQYRNEFEEIEEMARRKAL